MTVLRRIVDLLLAGLVVLVVALGLGANLGPQLGFEPFAVRTGSMTPAIPVGSLIVVTPVAPEAVANGDVLTVRVNATTTVTHRVVDVVVQDDGRMFRLHGDANERPDPVLVLPDQVVGRVAVTLPFLGLLLAMLGMPSGIAALLSFGGLLLTIAFLLDELEDAEAADDEEVETDGRIDVLEPFPLG